MKLYKLIFILIVFFETETLFSKNNIFNVNNIELEKKEKITNSSLADQAIKEGFQQLISRILLKKDTEKLSDLNFSTIKQLVTYYQIKDISNKNKKEQLVNFSVTFDKDKIHDLFYKRGVLYSDILDKELYVLPVLIKNNQIFIFNNNFFYENWNNIYEVELIEFILPLENIEIIKIINEYKTNLINLDLASLFQEYTNKNLALIIIEDDKANSEKIYIKTLLHGKNISRSIMIEKRNLDKNKINEKIITETKKELFNLIKSENLIDIRTPSFLNVKFDLNEKSNLVELNSRIQNIDSIENIYVQEFNKDFMNLRIKYLGKLEKMINLLKQKNIDLKLINDDWFIKAL